jgi:hypothetical protein
MFNRRYPGPNRVLKGEKGTLATAKKDEERQR